MPDTGTWLDRYPGVRALLQGNEELLDACTEETRLPAADTALASAFEANWAAMGFGSARTALQQTPFEMDAEYREAVRQLEEAVRVQRVSAAQLEALAALRGTVSTLETALQRNTQAAEVLAGLRVAHGFVHREAVSSQGGDDGDVD